MGTIDAGSEAISILLGDSTEYRLLDASGDPLDPENVAEGKFESDAMADLLDGAPVVQEVVGGHLRTVVPLTNDMHPNCITCHTNYAGMDPGTVVGAASFKVRL